MTPKDTQNPRPITVSSALEAHTVKHALLVQQNRISPDVPEDLLAAIEKVGPALYLEPRIIKMMQKTINGSGDSADLAASMAGAIALGIREKIDELAGGVEEVKGLYERAAQIYEGMAKQRGSDRAASDKGEDPEPEEEAGPSV